MNFMRSFIKTFAFVCFCYHKALRSKYRFQKKFLSLVQVIMLVSRLLIRPKNCLY